MDPQIPQEPTPDSPPRWRADATAPMPGETPAATPRRRAFVWLLALLVIGGALIGIIAWLRPVPKPYLAPLWVNDYQFRPFHAPPFGKQDQQALSDGKYFAHGLISLKALNQSSTGDTVVVYLSSYAFCDEAGRVMVLPSDAEMAAPQSFRPLQTILKALAESPAQKKLLVLDIAWPLDDPYLGGLDGGVAARIPAELDAVPDPQRLVLCSCAPGQVPLASPELQRSVFGFFLEDGLRGWADVEPTNPERQGLVTVKNLAAYVRTKVDAWAQRQHNARQTPILYGDAGDFPLTALRHGKPAPHLESVDADAYPAWLVEAWKTRELWRTQARHRFNPWLDRQLETAIVAADRNWRTGGDAESLRKELTAELDLLEKQHQRLTPTPKVEPLSLAQHRAAGKVADPKTPAALKEFFKRAADARASAAKPEDGERNVVKITDEFIEKNKAMADFDWVSGIFEFLAAESFPRRDTMQFGARLMAVRPGHAKIAEAVAVQRLAKLTEHFDDQNWPAPLLRKAILLIKHGENAMSRSRSYGWLSAPLESAAQKRHDADVLLHARGYVPLAAVEPVLTDALRAMETVSAQQDAIEDALDLTQDALALLPGYVPALDHWPAAEPHWHEAARASLELQALLQPGDPAKLNSLVDDARHKTQGLRAAIQQLKQMHAAEVIDDLLIKARRPDADVKLLLAIEAQLASAHHAGETRAKLWQARTELGAKVAAKILAPPTDLTLAEATAPLDERRQLADARDRAARSATRSLALLRLAGLPTDSLQRVEKLAIDFKSVKATDMAQAAPDLRLGFAAAQAIRNAWAQSLAEQAAKADSIAQERISRIAPTWLRLGAREEALSRAALQNHQERQTALWTWLADRYRYEIQQPDAPGFAVHAASALREFAPTEATGPALPVSATLVELTAAKPAAKTRISMRWQALPKNTPPVTMHAIPLEDDWLEIAADQTVLDALTTLPRDRPGSIEMPVRVMLKPQGEFSAAPRPLGFLLGFESGGRTFHHKVDLAQLPSAERLEIVVSTDPKKADDPLGDLRLRPSKERQAFYIYINNRGDKPRNLAVELEATGRVLAAGATTAVAKETTRVVLGGIVPPAKTPPPVKDELKELTGPIVIRVLDRDRKQQVVATRELRVDLAQPREYVRVPEIRFTPDDPAKMSRNRLDITLQAARKLIGPPCEVELVVPIERIAGLQAVRGGTFRGELPPEGEPLKLGASEFEFEPIGNDSGVVYLTVDGIERAFIFRTTFAPVGEPTIPFEETRPALRLQTAPYFKTNTRFEAQVEVDHSPADARLLVSLGRLRDKAFEAEFRHPALTPRQKRIGVGVRATDGGLDFDTLLRDWRVPFDAVLVRGERVVQARLVDGTGQDLLPPIYTRVLFDDRIPERVAFVDLPRQAKRDVVFPLKATGIDQGVGIKEVFFFVGRPTEDGKLPPNTVRIDAKPSPTEPDVWVAPMHWPDRKGPIDISVQFTNRLNLSTFAHRTIDLVDFDPEKTAPGTIDGIVVEGPRPQVGVKVELFDEKGKKLAEQITRDGGAFAFLNVPPGRYTVVASKPTSSSKLTGTAKIELAPGKSKRITLALYL